MNPLDSITGTIISGFVLTLILVFVIKAIAPETTALQQLLNLN